MVRPRTEEGARLARDLMRVTLHGSPPVETTMKVAAACDDLARENERLRRKIGFIKKCCVRALDRAHPYEGTVLTIIDLIEDMERVDAAESGGPR